MASSERRRDPGRCLAPSTLFGRWGDTTPCARRPGWCWGAGVGDHGPRRDPQPPKGRQSEVWRPSCFGAARGSLTPRARRRRAPRPVAHSTRPEDDEPLHPAHAEGHPVSGGGSTLGSAIRRRFTAPRVRDAGPSLMMVAAEVQGSLTPTLPHTTPPSSSSLLSSMGEGGRRRSRPVGRSRRRVRARGDPGRERSGWSRRPR